jgi:HEAT repeat protein
VKKHAASALGSLGAKEYAKEIAGLLNDADSVVQRQAVWALGSLGAKEYAKEIVKLLESRSPSLRASAAYALGQLDAREYEKDLVVLLNDVEGAYIYRAASHTRQMVVEQTTVSSVAAEVLKKWGATRAQPGKQE